MLPYINARECLLHVWLHPADLVLLTIHQAFEYVGSALGTSADERKSR